MASTVAVTMTPRRCEDDDEHDGVEQCRSQQDERGSHSREQYDRVSRDRHRAGGIWDDGGGNSLMQPEGDRRR